MTTINAKETFKKAWHDLRVQESSVNKYEEFEDDFRKYGLYGRKALACLNHRRNVVFSGWRTRIREARFNYRRWYRVERRI